MAKSTLNIDQELHSDSLIYRIESVLGQGSFGITYKAKAFTVIKGKFGEELVETNTPKAIKEFFMREVNEREESGSITGMSKGGLSYNYAQKFKKEAENLASMNHPNIVKVIDFISANNTYYYVMDFIEGENLNDYLKHHKMSEKEATDNIMEVAKALKYMHEEKHMLHLDLKPGNIMRRESDGHIFLIDFGLSKHYSEEGVPETSTSVGLGTPGYAPIEQANSKNAKKFRETLDVYALGATFYKLLTGQTPPSADELVSDGDVVKDELAKLGINGVLASVVVNAMKPSVKERIQNVAEFLDSFKPKYTKTDIAVVVAENEDTILDSPEKKIIAAKKKTTTNPKGDKSKKETKPHKEQRPKPQKVEAAASNKSEDESSNGGCLKTILVVVALCLFLLWYNDIWFFSQERVDSNDSHNEQVVDSQSNESYIKNRIINSQLKEGMIDDVEGLHTPEGPTSIDIKERNIRDLLYFPYGCFATDIDTEEKAKKVLTDKFGLYESDDQDHIGIHLSEKYDFTYRGIPIGRCIMGFQWYKGFYNFFYFYFTSKKDADKFYSLLVGDIKKVGVVLNDHGKYGFHIEKEQTTSFFRDVRVYPAERIDNKDEQNQSVNKKDFVGMYCVMLWIERSRSRK